MGYLREKYTSGYFLCQDKDGHPSEVGVIGVQEFMDGEIRFMDKHVLSRVMFSNKNVIDFGYGRGEAIKFSLEHGAKKVIGVDFSEASKKIADGMLKKFNLKAELYCEDALKFVESLNENDSNDKFDVVIMLDFVEHIPRDEFKKLLKLLKNFLNERSVIVINTPVFKIDNDVLREGLKKEAMDNSDEYEETKGMHCNRYTRKSLEAFMASCNFGIISGHIFGLNYYPKKYENMEIIWKRALREGYPVIGKWSDELYEYAMTSDEIKKKQNLINKKLDIYNDYNFNNLKKVKFSDFSMFITDRFKDFYIPDKFENFTSDLLLNFIKDGDVFVDVGAHYGYYSLLASRNIGSGEIFSFEPVKENYDLLNKNIDFNRFGNVKSFNYAITNKGGLKDFNITEASDSSGFYEHPFAKTIERRNIKSYSLDEFFGKKKVDIIKIDTEGHELFVLEGMSSIIMNNDDIKVFIEFNPACLKNSKTKPVDLLIKIINYNFDIYFIDDQKRKLHKIEDVNNWEWLLGKSDYINILCIKKDKSIFTCFFSHSGNIAGAELSMVDLIDYQVANGGLVHVLVPSDGPLVEIIKKKPVSYDISYYPRWTSDDKNFIDQVATELEESSIDIILNLKYINPHVILTNTSVINIGAIVAKALNKPHIWHISEFGKKEHGVNYLLEKSERMRYINNYSDRIVFVSNALKEYYGNNVDGKKSEVIYNNVRLVKNNSEEKKKYFQDNKFKILLLGNIYSGKRQLDVIMAVKKIVNQGVKDIELIIAGSASDDGYYNEILKYIKQNKLSKFVNVIDYVDNPYSIIDECDILISASENESFGRVLIEAMILKKAIVGAMSGATAELIKDGYNGLLFEPQNINDLADKIIELKSQQDRGKKFGENGFQYYNDKFNYENLSKHYFDMILNLKNSKCWIGGELNPDRIISKIISSRMDNMSSLNFRIEMKNDEIRDLKQTIKNVNHQYSLIINQKNEELDNIYSSNIWKFKIVTEKIFFLIFKPHRFYNKYSGKIKYLVNSLVFNLKVEGLFKTFIRAVNYIRYGKGTLDKINGIVGCEGYSHWINNYETKFKKKKHVCINDKIEKFSYFPKISILFPVYNTDEIFLRKAIISVLNQYYKNWELCIIDDNSSKKIIRIILDEFCDKDPRIKVKYSEVNNGISIATNMAAEMATGDFLAFLDHDDEIEPEALFENVEVLNKNPNVDLIYSDDDKINEYGIRYDPQFKPNWSPELLLSYSYVGHFRVVRNSIFKMLNGFRKEFDGSQDYDFLLRFSEISNRVEHIPSVLYHWRSLPGSVAKHTDEKPLSIEKGRLALEDALSRRHIKADVVIPHFAEVSHIGVYKFKFSSNNYTEKVTIIIPTKDNVDLLEKCITTVRSKTNYINYEILVINNNSKKIETEEFLKRNNIKYFNIKTENFNYAYINNIAVGKVESELILFLNNDTEIVSDDWLLDMVGAISLDKKIGAIGAKLIYEDKRIQHAGIILGLNNLSAGHANKLMNYKESGYLNYNLVMRNYSAVTAACMLTRKSLFNEVDGFDDKNLPVAYNDVDYCLKLIKKGYRIVYCPSSILLHKEGASRGKLDNVVELNYFKNKWKKSIENDYYYNINLSLEDEQFKIKK